MTLRNALALVLVLSIAAITDVCAQTPAQPAVSAEGVAALAPTPPMGWASWNHFFCDYDEKTIREQADALVSTGMRDAGYNYVVIQECIARQRDASGKLIADAERFPSGMPALTAYIHSRGLKAGVYTDIGKHTCYPNPQYQGSYGHEQQDADTFAQWGMDFVEMDFCNREPEHSGRWVYERMAQAIHNTGRPMIFYLCAWGNEEPWEWAQGKAQMWRTEFDISLEKNHVEWLRLVRNFESNTVHSVLSGPESWNDADMLEIGNPGLSDIEAQAQMSMWAISPSPLLAGADLVHMSARSREIYLNKEVIAINQDALGAGADKISEPSPGVEIWAKPLGSRTSGDMAVLLLNASNSASAMQMTWDQLGLKSGAARDLWLHKQVPSSAIGYQTQIAPHSAALLLVHGERSWQHGAVLEAEWPGFERLGNASLFPCGECSRGYAMALGGSGRSGSVIFKNLVVPAAGAYTARLTYTRNGLEDKQINVSVNSSQQKVLAIMRSWNWVDVPVMLHAGSNDIAVGYDGQQSFYLDKVTLMKGTIKQ
jgi:alpha-galactosidase